MRICTILHFKLKKTFLLPTKDGFFSMFFCGATASCIGIVVEVQCTSTTIPRQYGLSGKSQAPAETVYYFSIQLGVPYSSAEFIDTAWYFSDAGQVFPP